MSGPIVPKFTGGGGGGTPLPSPTDPGDVLTLDAGLDPVWLPPSGGAPIGTPGDFAWFAHSSGSLSDGSGTNRDEDGQIVTFEQKDNYTGSFELWKQELVLTDSDLNRIIGNTFIVDVRNADNTISDVVNGRYTEVLAIGNCNIISIESDIESLDPGNQRNGAVSGGYRTNIITTAETSVGLSSSIEVVGSDFAIAIGSYSEIECDSEIAATSFYADLSQADSSDSPFGMPLALQLEDGGTWQLWQGNKVHGGVGGSPNKPLNFSLYRIDANEVGASPGQLFGNQYRGMEVDLDDNQSFDSTFVTHINDIIVDAVAGSSTEAVVGGINLVSLEEFEGNVDEIGCVLSNFFVSEDTSGSVNNFIGYGLEVEVEPGSSLSVDTAAGFVVQGIKELDSTLIFGFLCEDNVTSTTAGSWRVGNTQAESHPNVGIEIADINKVLKLPVITEAERNTLPTPETGWVVLVSDGATPGLQYWDGTSWEKA